MTGESKKYTYQALVDEREARGDNNAVYAIGRMMDDVGEETGAWPGWDEPAPDWVCKACGM